MLPYTPSLQNGFWKAQDFIQCPILVSAVVEIKSQRNVLENIQCFLLHIETPSREEKYEHLLLYCRKEEAVHEPQWKSKSHGKEVGEDRIKSSSNSLDVLARC